MVDLALISLPFLILGWLVPRTWLIAVPFVFWLAFAWLEARGILSGSTDLNSALLVGIVGALSVAIGIGLRDRLRPGRSSTP